MLLLPVLHTAGRVRRRPDHRTASLGALMSADLTVEVSDGVAVLTLNRPDHRNAYTADMGALLGQAYRSCDDDDDVRAIVLTGAGTAFCAGADFSNDASPFDSPDDA